MCFFFIWHWLYGLLDGSRLTNLHFHLHNIYSMQWSWSSMANHTFVGVKRRSLKGTLWCYWLLMCLMVPWRGIGCSEGGKKGRWNRRGCHGRLSGMKRGQRVMWLSAEQLIIIPLLSLIAMPLRAPPPVTKLQQISAQQSATQKQTCGMPHIYETDTKTTRTWSCPPVAAHAAGRPTAASSFPPVCTHIRTPRMKQRHTHTSTFTRSALFIPCLAIL